MGLPSPLGGCLVVRGVLWLLADYSLMGVHTHTHNALYAGAGSFTGFQNELCLHTGSG